mgnify:CR=1 FL=1
MILRKAIFHYSRRLTSRKIPTRHHFTYLYVKSTQFHIKTEKKHVELAGIPNPPGVGSIREYSLQNFRGLYAWDLVGMEKATSIELLSKFQNATRENHTNTSMGEFSNFHKMYVDVVISITERWVIV